MIRFYHSNDLDVLKSILLQIIKQQPLSPFEKESILVQSQGMAHWLKLNVADGLGVAAQLDFPLPFSFVWQVFNALRPDLPQRSHFDKPFMTWKLLQLLPQLIENARNDSSDPCAAIAHYLDDDADGLRCFQLAETIADVFDQYLVYRPDWLLKWEQGSDEIDDADIRLQPWQPVVWRALVEHSKQLGHSLDHRARLMDQLAELVQQHPERLQNLPKRLFVFGISALPGSYWQVLNAISSEIEVHFFLLNPCRNFWGDIVDDRRRARILRHHPESAQYLERGNPLLASWGQLGRDFLTLVHDTELDLDVEAWVDREEDHRTLLQHLQADVLELTDRQQPTFTAQALVSSEFKQTVDPSDDSIRIISGHSQLREVQRLHDQLLYWFDQDPHLQPRDVVVMVPDIDSYAPYIDAVFASADVCKSESTATSRSLRIPWAIADQALVTENPLLDSFLALLGLPDSRLTITEVQDWLEVPAIRARFGIAADELDTIKDWLQRARIRWGMDAVQRHRLGLPEFEQNSWRKGLRQLLLGLMIPDQLPGSALLPGWHGDWPIAAVEGGAAELLGKLISLIDALEHWQTELASAANGQQWGQRIRYLLDDLFTAELANVDGLSANEQQQQQYSLQLIRDLLQNWQQELQLGGLNHPEDETMRASAEAEVIERGAATCISARIVRSWFKAQLGQQGGWQRFLVGPVNFCTLMPMRSIPFKVVCMLGMNDSDYPRKVTPVGFDLITAGRRRQGDRSRRDDDRYLFLEALASAQQKLYISYRGRSVRENNELQPSVLVSELQDYICDGYCLPEWQPLPHVESRKKMQQWLVEELPLQAFSNRAYQPLADSAPRAISSYQPLWAAVANSHSSASGTLGGRSVAVETALTSAQKTLQLPQEWLESTDEVFEVNLEDVQSALVKSSHFYLRHRLRVSLDPTAYEEETDTEEPFDPDNLEMYQFRGMEVERLLQSNGHAGAGVDSGAVLDQARQRLQSLGQLPVEQVGELVLREARYSVVNLAEKLRQWNPDSTTSVALQAELDAALVIPAELQQQWQIRTLRLTGDVAGWSGATLVRWRCGSVRGSHLLKAWAEMLLAKVAGHFVTDLVYFGINKKDGSVTEQRIKCPDEEQARNQLTHMVAYYVQSWLQPGDLLPDLLCSWLQADENKEQQVVAEALKSEFGEINQLEVERCLPHLAEQLQDDDGFQQWQQQYQWLELLYVDNVMAPDSGVTAGNTAGEAQA